MPKKEVKARPGKVLIQCSICNKSKNRTQRFIDRLNTKGIKYICSRCKKVSA